MSYTVMTGDIVELTTVCQQVPQISENKTHWRVTVTGTSGISLGDIASAFDSLVHSDYKALLSSAAANYYGVSAAKVWPLPRPLSEFTIANFGIGTNAGTPAPAQLSAIIRLLTGLAGPGFRGRQYMPFPCTSAITALGNPTNAYAALLSPIALTLKSPFPVAVGLFAVTMTPVLWNRTTHTATNITDSLVVQKFATMKKRGVYGRPNVLPF